MLRRVWLALAVTGCKLHFDDSHDAATTERPCPDDFIFVTGNPALGTSDFCAMKFEAKARDLGTQQIVANGCNATCDPDWGSTGYGAASASEGAPFRSVNALDAQRMCRELGTGYDLMANREWMTIARQAEANPANWQSGTPGTGRIAQGNTNGSTPGQLACTDESDPYNGTGDDAMTAWDQRRIEVLANGEVIWDFAGNVQEWIDFTLAGPYDPPPSCSSSELPTVSCAGLSRDDFQSTAGTLDSTNGVGKLIGGSGNALRRGGQTGDFAGDFAGIYALNMNRFTNDTFPATGFRCVLRL
ncbi:MAG TPA: hypothetical protein VMZ53_20865 [Kofleriaceae bacterium]|nr:hypothetical protein [Kofleriaceae bacterium]